MGAVIGVVGAAGGVGASTFAAVLAAVGGGVLVDIDAAGAGVDVLLGIDSAPGARWSAVRVAGGEIDPGQLADGLPRWGGTHVLAADVAPPADAVAPLVRAAARLGPVALDLGRAASPARAAACGVCDLVAIVVPGDAVGVAGARVQRRDVERARVALVVRRGPVSTIDVEAALAAPEVGVLPALGVRSGTVLGETHLPRALVQVAAGILDGLQT
jgi:hypothetical protein